MEIYKRPFKVFVYYNGENRFIKTIEVKVFKSCGEEILTVESSERIEEIKRKYVRSAN